MSYQPRRRCSSLRQSFNDSFKALSHSPTQPGLNQPLYEASPQASFRDIASIQRSERIHAKLAELRGKRSSTSVSLDRVSKPVHQRRSTLGSTSRSDAKRTDNLRVSLLRDQAQSRPQSSMGRIEDIALKQQVTSPADFQQTFQDDLNNFNSPIPSYFSDEMSNPPTPRARSRRMDGKEFGRQRAQEIKRRSNAQGYLFGLHSPSLRQTDQPQPREAYAPGVIISAPYHTSSNSGDMFIAADDPNLTATPFGTVCSKFRKMVVLKVFGEHCTCLPIYTHNGLGLQGKRFPGEFVSIRDVADPDPEEPEGPHMVLWAEKYNTFRGKGVAGKSVVKLTETYSHRYASPATIEGILDAKSLSQRRLVELVKAITG